MNQGASTLDAALSAAGLSLPAVSGLPLFSDAANRFTAAYTSSVDSRVFNLPLTELRDYSKARSAWYASLARATSIDHAIAVASSEFHREIPGDSTESQYARITDPTFWKRYYSTNAKRAHEFAYIRAGFVSGAKERYVSDSTLALYRNLNRPEFCR